MIVSVLQQQSSVTETETCGLQNLTYLVFGSLQKRLADP